MTRKKLQVFVSSTYKDLTKERQAAVEAILTAGHIPAGMELFAAGDAEQMSVIKRWIDESDVFLLVLGGRYGSVDLKSQKSYIHLEYEYAVAEGKPVFAVVIEEGHLKKRVRTLGTEAIEPEFPQKLREFREVVLSRMVRFWSDPRDIKVAILEAMAEFSRRPELVGWVPGNEAATIGVAKEIARLSEENAALRSELAKLTSGLENYGGLSFEELYNALASWKGNLYELPGYADLQDIARAFGDSEPGLLHLFWMLSRGFNRQMMFANSGVVGEAVSALEDFFLVELDRAATKKDGRPEGSVYKLTESGKRFLARLKMKRNTEKNEGYHALP